MDPRRFDQLAKAFSAAGTRRGLVRVLSVLPLGGWLAVMLGDQESAAKRRRKAQGKKGHKDRGKGRDKGGDQAGADNHKHEGRRRKHNNPHGNHHHKKKTCKPESSAQTCEGKCGAIENNCKKQVDCGSCACDPPCPVCKICNPDTTQCEGDPAQVGEVCGDGLVCQADGSCACQGNSCGGCRACDGSTCVPDPSVLCTPSDQCHEAGVCDPETGACTNPSKSDDTPCDDGDPCTNEDTCQNGVCTGGTPKDCSGEDDVCNVGACRSSDGACFKRPRVDGTGCNADNTDCTAGDSCQNGVCTPGAGIDCRGEDDQCNRGVCRQSDGACIKEPRPNDTACASGNPCTQPDTCQNGSCIAGPLAVCTPSDECHLAGTCNPATGFCSNPQAPDGTSCGINGGCVDGACVEICLSTDAVCDPGNDACCGDEGEFCSESAACAGGGEGRCCRDEGADCARDCDCCDGVCAGGVCCQPNRQCNGTSDCCEGFVCIDTVCTQVCGTNHAICTDIPCCDGFRCVRGECSPNTCLALTETCVDPGQCCQEGGTTCTGGKCCQASNQTCDSTAECCFPEVCGPQGRCCQGSFFDRDRPQVRGCIANGNCCPGRRCDRFTDTCCLVEGQQVPPGSLAGDVDCCHFASRNGVCICHADGETCAAPFGHPFISNCCDGLLCIDEQCQPPCAPWSTGGGCSDSSDCCRGHTCEANSFCSL